MHRFDGEIAGLGTVEGTRVVLGMWRETPFGTVADAMIERPDGHRLLIAPTRELADYVAATYTFDEVRIEPVELFADVTSRTFLSATLRVRVETGRRTAVGRLLNLVPPSVARSRWWCRAIDPIARTLRHGVRTVGTAGGGRREYYCALDEHRLVAARATFEGHDLGTLRPVTPAVRFGFASTPPTPAIVAVTTLIDGADELVHDEQGGGDAEAW